MSFSCNSVANNATERAEAVVYIFPRFSNSPSFEGEAEANCNVQYIL